MKLTLEHKREGHAYDGRVILDHEDGGDVSELTIFNQFSFARMMARFSKFAGVHPEADLYMLRTEREELKPFLLDPLTSQKLREDPAAVIQEMTMADRQVEKAKLQLEDSIKITSEVNIQLRAGHDTLADAIGDHIYIKLRPHSEDGMQGECPFTGKWCGFGAKADAPDQLLLKTGRQNAHVDWLAVELVPPSRPGENPKWLKVSTEALLSHKLDGEEPERFFIPRKWNKTSPWINRGSLGQLFGQYQKEKESCSTDPKE